MVGNACAAGWNIGASLKMTQDPVNKFLFTWIGQLSAGELKFPLDTPSDWSCDFIMAASENQSITDSRAVKRNSPDTKWLVLSGEAGRYKVTVDTYHMTVTFESRKKQRYLLISLSRIFGFGAVPLLMDGTIRSCCLWSMMQMQPRVLSS